MVSPFVREGSWEIVVVRNSLVQSYFLALPLTFKAIFRMIEPLILIKPRGINIKSA